MLEISSLLTKFYSLFKSLDYAESVEFTFISGVTKAAQSSLFINSFFTGLTSFIDISND